MCRGDRLVALWNREVIDLQTLSAYLRPDLLILDDFGLRPLAGSSPEDLYDIINERYEKGSILLTSNRSPKEWPSLFGNPLLLANGDRSPARVASAGLDRLGIGRSWWSFGESYRAQSRTRPEESPPISASPPSMPEA